MSCATAVSRGPSRAITRARCASLSDGDSATSRIASTREAVTFACWPPGPDDRDVFTSISASGIDTSRVTRIGSSIVTTNMTNRPDPDRLGGIGWARRTNGNLTSAEKRRLLGEIVKGQGQALVGRIKIVTGRVPTHVAELDDPTLLAPPDSAWARAAEAAADEQTAATKGHGYRTWAFGRALAALEKVPVDAEILYTASLLHDLGIEHQVTDQDFTVRSAERVVACAHEAGVDDARADLAADAIVSHFTPGGHPRIDADGAWVQAGALCDLLGVRKNDFPRAWVQQVNADHPRDGVVDAFARMINAEKKAVPNGRLALVGKCGFVAAMRTATKYGT